MNTKRVIGGIAGATALFLLTVSGVNALLGNGPRLSSPAQQSSSSQQTESSNVQVLPTQQEVIPTPTPEPSPQPVQSSTLSNDDYYTNSAGNTVHSPAYSDTVPTGATAKCGDGTYSFSQSRRGTCSHHGGVTIWY